MALFGFGAFSTPVGSLIEQATDNSASAGNIAIHLQICDAVNDSDSGPKEAIGAIRKRFTGSSKNYHIINLTLTILESCVKNCGIRFHSKVAQRDFLKDLMSIINPKNNPPTIVRERVLGLIQYWVDAFKDKPQLSAVQEVYAQLRDEGVEFPPLDLDSFAPIDTPDRATTGSSSNREQLEIVQPAAGGQMQQQHQHRQRSQRTITQLRPEQIAKLLSELDIVRKNIDVMNEILIENEPGKEGEDDFLLMQELYSTLEAMQERATQLIGRVSEEIVLESLLQINDELNSCFTRHDRHMKNRQAVLNPSQSNSEAITSFSPLPEVPDVSLPTVSYPTLDKPPAYESSGDNVGTLIDLGVDLGPTPAVPPQTMGGDILGQLADLGISSGPTPSVPPMEESDEFDMFAASRLAYSTTGGSTYEDNTQAQGTSISSALHRLPQPIENTYSNPQSFVLSTPTTPAQDPSIEDQVTSAEFDQFLAERASKSKHRPQMQNQEDTTDTMFEL